MSLQTILNELQQHKHLENREEVLTKYIEERLRRSLNTYYEELDNSLMYLAAHDTKPRDDVRFLKKLNPHRI